MENIPKPGVESSKTMKINTRTSLQLCILALCGLWLALWVVRIAQNIGAPQIEYSEGFNTYLARLFTSGQWSWSLPSTPPFNVSFYTPIGFYVLGFVNRIFGESLVVGRMLNLFYTLGCMVMVFLIVKHETKDKLASIIAAAFPMTAVTMIAWSFFIRVDLLAVMFDLIGVYIVLRNKEISAVFWAIPIFLLAFYTKQSVLAGGLATCVYLLINNRRRGILFTTIFALSGIVTLGIAEIITHGGFLKEILLYQRTSPAFQNPINIFLTVATSACLYLPAVVMAANWLKDNLRHFLSLFMLSALAVGTLTLLHPGGNINYLFEVIFALSILAGIWLGTADITDKGLNIVITGGIFTAILWTLGVSGLMGEAFPDKLYREKYSQAVSIISDAHYPILTENAGMVLDAGQVPYDEPFVFDNLARLGYFNENILLDDLNTGRIDYVVTQFPLPNTHVRRFDAAVQNAIVDNYHIVLSAATDENYSFVVYKANRTFSNYSFVIYKVN